MIYWINNHVGTASLAEVKKITQKNCIIISVIHLSDYYNPPEQIYLTIKKMMPLFYIPNNKIVINCIAGVNRSNAIATTILAYFYRLNWDEMFKIVKQAVPRAQVTPELRESCIKALEMMKRRLVKRCKFCTCPIEFWEDMCEHCWHKKP